MMLVLTTFVSEVDPLDASHRAGAFLLLILAVILTGFYIRNRKRKDKNRKVLISQDNINAHYVAALILFLNIIVTVFLDGWIEILAGVLAIAVVLWHIKNFD